MCPRSNQARRVYVPDEPAHKLKDVSSATDGVSHCPSDHEDQADQEHDDADCPKDRYGGDEANGEKDYADDNHGEVTTSEVSGRCKPTLSTHTVEGSLDPNTFPEC